MGGYGTPASRVGKGRVGDRHLNFFGQRHFILEGVLLASLQGRPPGHRRPGKSPAPGRLQANLRGEGLRWPLGPAATSQLTSALKHRLLVG
jgi:hypothetical protein